MHLPMKTLVALLPFFLQQVSAQASGSGKTTRYWDCCKASCSWPGKAALASGSGPVGTCDVHDKPLSDPSGNAPSGCNGGTSYMCSSQSPWAVSDTLAYGYAAVNIAGGSESSWCCACYELTFTSTALATSGKKMIVQATNTGGDLGSNQFDIAIPGGGVGIFNGCTTEFGAPSSGWGNQYGGISDASACSAFPAALKPGCGFRFDWFMGADNPTVDFKQVACPAALTKSTGCKRADDSRMPAPPATGGTSNKVVAPVEGGSAPSASSSASTLVASSSSAESSSATVIVAPTTSDSSSATVIVAPTTSASSSASTEIVTATPSTKSTKTHKTKTHHPTTSASAGDDDDDTCDAE